MISTLNNFRYNIAEPLYTNENIEKVKNYIRTRTLPTDLTNIQMKRFIERFKYGYTINNNKVYYKHLELVSKEDMMLRSSSRIRRYIKLRKNQNEESINQSSLHIRTKDGQLI